MAAAPATESEPALGERWQLSGVVQSHVTHVVLLTDLADASIRTATPGKEVDGWLVKDAGPDGPGDAKGNAADRP
jgi:hypothetical protein